jgi:RNA polymerase sigma-70 factor (ECF subfamily)
MERIQERELVEAAKCDSQAFAALYDRYYSPIFGYVLVRVAKLDVAQDITSEVFFKALISIKRYRWRGVQFSTWLYRIANHEIANHYRANGHGLALVERVAEAASFTFEAPEEEMEDAEQTLSRYQVFLEAQKRIARLPLKYQQVIVLRFFEDKPLAEIGLILGKKESTVKTLLYRGLDKLKEELNSERKG